ncbi:MAG: glycosyltransferase family 39 protein [Verrucomicrobiota bacterium]|nr:glycosyltransferase family 39 protein [Verrucomicrobiota bacterium]
MWKLTTPQRYRWAFAVMLLAATLFRAWHVTTLPLSGDEAYHWEWSRHLALGYYDHPGLTAYCIWLSTHLLGRSTEFSVRLPAVVLGAGTAIVCFLLAVAVAREKEASPLESGRAGFLAGALALITPILAFLSGYMSTDPPLLFAWALSLFLFYRALTHGRWPDWIGGGVAYGLALQSKFLAFFLAAALAAFVLMSSADRKWLRRPRPYVAAAIAMLIVSPFLWWNAEHQWATFLFNFAYRQQRAFAPQHLLVFLAVSALVSVSPGLFAWSTTAIAEGFRRWFHRQERGSLYLIIATAVPLAYFLYESLWQPISPHWPAAAWLGVLVWLGVEWSPLWAAGRRPPLARTSIGIALIVVLAAHVALHWPPECVPQWSYSPQPTRINTAKNVERFGWPELGARIAEVRDAMTRAQQANAPDSGRDGVFLITDQYGLSAAVAFYTPGQPRSHLWRRRMNCGENYRYWDDFRALGGQDVIFVTKRESHARRAAEQLAGHCRRVDPPETVAILRNGLELRAFHLVRGYRFDGEPPEFGD